MTTPTKEQILQMFTATMKKREKMPEQDKASLANWLFEEGILAGRADLESQLAEKEAEIKVLEEKNIRFTELWFDQCNRSTEQVYIGNRISKELKEALKAISDKAFDTLKLTPDEYYNGLKEIMTKAISATKENPKWLVQLKSK